jgi:hypothetical protein
MVETVAQDKPNKSKEQNMKTRNQFVTMALIAILGIVAGLTACDDKPTDCNCQQTYGTTAHLGTGETCPCPASKPCGCTQQTATVTGTTIPISKKAGITVKQMNDTVTNINTAYGQLITESQRNKFTTNVKEIHIVSGDELNLNGTTLNVGESASYADLLDYILDHCL